MTGTQYGVGKTRGDPSSGWLGRCAPNSNRLPVHRAKGEVAAILHIRGDQSMLRWLTLIPSLGRSVFSLSPGREVPFSSGPSIQIPLL